MPDEPNTPPADSTVPTTTPVVDPNKGGTPSTTPTADSVKLAEELGTTKAELKVLKEYQERVDPFLQTVYSPDLDEATRNKLLEVHNKRLGISTPTIDPKIETHPGTPTASEVESRNAHISNIVNDFYENTGISKLDEESKKDINTRVGAMLQNMLDPKGNKTLAQIMDDVSLVKLPDFLKNAYYLATKEDAVAAAREAGKREAIQESTGVIGSMASSSGDDDPVNLSGKEKEIAKKMGISEEKYLENKKAIIARDNQLF